MERTGPKLRSPFPEQDGSFGGQFVFDKRRARLEVQCGLRGRTSAAGIARLPAVRPRSVLRHIAVAPQPDARWSAGHAADYPWHDRHAIQLRQYPGGTNVTPSETPSEPSGKLAEPFDGADYLVRIPAINRMNRL